MNLLIVGCRALVLRCQVSPESLSSHNPESALEFSKHTATTRGSIRRKVSSVPIAETAAAVVLTMTLLLSLGCPKRRNTKASGHRHKRDAGFAAEHSGPIRRI
jgi:hypothetical protein